MRTPLVARLSAPFLALLALLAILAASAAGAARAAEETFLEPDKAFVFSARPLDAKTVEVTFDIAPGYYLYREQFAFAADGATLGAAAIPPGKMKFDQTFNKNVETYRQAVKIAVPVEAGAKEFRLTTTSQGCADAGLCYPPMQSAATVSLVGFGGNGTVAPATLAAPGEARSGPAGGATALSSPGAPAVSTGAVAVAGAPAATATSLAGSEAGTIEAALRGGGFWPVVGVFFVAGVLLSLTPCVLPMLPIVSSIIVGQGGYGARPALAGAGGGAGLGSGSGGGTGGGGASNAAGGAAVVRGGKVSRGRGFALAASYSLGMAVVYTAFGIAAGLAGEGLAAALQNPWVLGAFALGLVALSLSMFGVYELSLPSALTCRVAEASQKLPGGKVAGVAAMGGISALIVSPCVAAPLAGALLYLSQTRDVWLGGTALFSLAAGMSVPLLLVGASAGALLPKAGPWMVEVKVAFGILLLGVALWTVQPVLHGSLATFLWGALAIGAAAAVLLRRPPGRPAVWRAAAAAVLGLAGAVQVVGAASGGVHPLQPLAGFGGGRAGAESALRFAPVKTSADLDAALARADRPVILDFYADWCVSCKEMDHETFADRAVQRKMEGAILLRADVTANDVDDRALLRRFRLFGPPGLVFFGADRREIGAARVIGYQKPERFLDSLARAGL